MAIIPPTPPTPPTPPKITLGDAAHEAQNNTTHTTGDVQAEQQARDSVARGNGALSKTTTGTSKDRANNAQIERADAGARSDAAGGDRVNTSRSRVDHGTKLEGQTGADAADGLSAAEENAILKKQLGIAEDGQTAQSSAAAQPPQSYTAASAFYWAGLLAFAAFGGFLLFRRFFRRKPDIGQSGAAPHLADRILAMDRGGARGIRTTEREREAAQDHAALLSAAAKTRRSRDTHGEILTEYTGLTAGEALERLAAREPGRRPQAGADAPMPKKETARRPDRSAAAARPEARPQKKEDPSAAQRAAVEEQPHFEVRV